MYKVLRSYSKKAERKHESSRASDGKSNGHYVEGGYTNGHGGGGQLAVADSRQNAAFAGVGFSESSSYEAREHFERKVQRVKKTRSERERSRSARRGDEASDVNGHDVSARDALLQWARKTTEGYPRVNVTNFSSSWRDGLAFNAILHRYRPNLINWEKISDPSVSNRERLSNAFEVAKRAFDVDKLLDPEDVDVDHPDEKSLITYVSSLYNNLPHLPDLSKGSLADLISRLQRGIGITNEKLDLILVRIEDVEAQVETGRPSEIERKVNEIVDDLNALESPILGFFEDVDTLKQHNHPDANDFYRQVYGLHQRRAAYLDRLTNQLLVRLGQRSETMRKQTHEQNEAHRASRFGRVEECIEWVRTRMTKLTEMEFVETLETLEEMFEQHKIDNRDIQDFRQDVDQCIARQSEVSAEDSVEYCELLRILESEYQQLRDLSAGRMLDLDSLIAFVRAAQLELVWVNEREEIEVHRNWSDVKQLDLPMLTNYYKQLLHEMELREPQYNDVHNKGAALLNQGHPAVHVIEVYLRTMRKQWDWLLNLSKCLEEHLRDALNLKTFMEEAQDAEALIKEQFDILERNYNRTDFTLEEGERFLRELDEMKEILNRYQSVLHALSERCKTISPLWQRGERISRPIPVTALCDYQDNNVNIQAGDEVTLLDNSDLVQWHIRDITGGEGTVPSVVFRIPPPDTHLTAYLTRLLQQFEKLRKLWAHKHMMVRLNMVLNTMKTIQGWDIDTFNSIDPEQRDAIIKALNDDTNKLLSELDPNDPLYQRLKDELRKTMDHFWSLFNQSQKAPEQDLSNEFDRLLSDLLRKLEEAWRTLNDRTGKPVPRTPAELEKALSDQRAFEEMLQGLDGDIANLKELFRKLSNPTPSQRANMDRLTGLWDDLWDLSRMYVERMKVLDSVLNGIVEVSDIVRRHEITLNSFDDMPSSLDKLRGDQSELVQLNMVLQQQQTIIDQLNRNVALLRQHVARTRLEETTTHPDVDRIEEEVQQLNVRWENVQTQVNERFKATERAIDVIMTYRSEYDSEKAWLDRVEETINRLRKPEELRPEQYQQQLDLLVAEYAQLQERTEAIENVNREGGKFIREAKGYDGRLKQFTEGTLGIHGHGIRNEFKRTTPQPKNGAQIVTEELEALNRRFAQLSSLILERRNIMNVLIQNWKRQKQTPDLNIHKVPQVVEITSEDGYEDFDTTNDIGIVPKLSEHEDEMQMYQEETVTKTQFYEMEGILHKQTGEILTFVEAVRQGLLDLHSGGGEFFDIVSGSRISLEKAAELGYIDGGFTEVLHKHYGILHPETKQSITLLEAIQIGLYDPDNRQLRNIHTGEILSNYDDIITPENQRKLLSSKIIRLPPMGLNSALENGVVDPVSGHFTGKYTRESMPLKDALYQGYVRIVSNQQPAMFALSLSDVIKNDFINANNGEFEDRNSGDKFTLRDATSKQHQLINLHIPEVVNTADNTRLTLGNALVRNAVSVKNGNFTDLQTRRTMSLKEAYQEDLICKPLTLTEAHERDQIDSTGNFIDRGTKHRHTLLEAISAGLLDAEARHIVDQDEGDVISIAVALERGLLGGDSRIRLEKEQREFTIGEAVREGLLTKRARHSIFDIKGIRNTKTGQNMSFNEAVEAGAIVPQAGRVVDILTGQSYLYSDREATNIVDSTLLESLNKPVGIRGDLSIIQAVSKGLIDPVKAVFFDQNSKQELDVRDAYRNGLISLRGALKVGGLLDVHPSLIAPVKRVDKRKRISRPGQMDLAADQVKVTLAEAMKQGLIDSRTQRFRQGNIDVSLDEALSQGLIDPSSEWIVPSKTAGVGPTIEEKTTENVTETGQQLAPKYYPDKNIEESVTTVKRVRTTETTALGGPGGVSVYRAITGGKGTLEVPTDGYHIYEAERKGIIDLTTGAITVPNVDRKITFAEGIKLGVIDADTIKVVDPRSRRELNVKDAIEQKIIDENGFVGRDNIEKAIEKRSIIIDAEPLVPAAGKKVIQFSSGTDQVISFRPVGQPVVEESEQAWSFDAAKGILVDQMTGEQMGLDRALATGKLTHDDLRVEDAHTGRNMSFEEAIRWGIIDPKNSYYVDKRDNKRLSYTEAARDHRIYPTGGVAENAGDAVHTTVKSQTRTFVTKKEALAGGQPVGAEINLARALSAGQFNSSTGRFALPDSQKELTLKEAIIKTLFNPYDTTVVDRRNNKEISLLEAIQEGIVDDTAGTVLDTNTGIKHDLKTALQNGLLKGRSVADTIDFHSKAIAGATPSRQGSQRIVEQKLQLTPFSPSTNGHGASTGGHTGGSHVAFRQGQRTADGRQEVVDLGGGRQATFNVVRKEGGKEVGEYVDPSTGMKYTINVGGDPYVTETKTTVKSTQQVQSVELEPHAEFVGIDRIRDKRNGDIMSLEDAKRRGLAKVDRKGKQQTRSYSVFRSNVQNAVAKGVIDPHGEKISLEDAIRSRLIDIERLTYVNTKTGESLPLTQAANMGLVDVTLSETLPQGVSHPANGERIPISRAIQLGIIDARSGQVHNPFTKERLTWLDLLRPVYNAVTSEGIYDPTKGYGVPVTAALNDGLIVNGKYHNSITGEDIDLEEASRRGLIDKDTYEKITRPFFTDHRTNRVLNLVDAVAARLIDPKNRTAEFSRHSIIPISTAIHDGRIPSDIGAKLRKVDKMTFAEAFGKGLINTQTNVFTDPDTGRQITLEQAISEGHIDTGSVQPAEGSDEKNLANIINSEEFDKNSGRIRDKKTGLNLTFKQAIEREVIDPQSLLHDLDSGATLTIQEAISRGKIDSDGHYIEQRTGQKLNLKDAEAYGLIALIASPMHATQSITEAVKKREKEGYRFKLENVGDGSHQQQRHSQTRFGDSGRSAGGYGDSGPFRSHGGYSGYGHGGDSRYGGHGGDSGPSYREETTTYKFSTPRQEPTLSVRMRSSEVGNTDRARSLVDDPSALADRQNDFISELESRGFDTDMRVIENPAGRQRVSVREAAETGLLDVMTGDIVHPETGNRYSIPKAVHMKLLNSEAGKQLMEGLNLKMEDFAGSNPNIHSTTTYHQTSSHFDEPTVASPSESANRTWTKTISWTGKPDELRHSGGDPLGPYTQYTSPKESGGQDAPLWTRREY